MAEIYTAVVEGDTGPSNKAGGHDLFEVTAPANSMVKIREVRVGQYSDAGDAEAEMLNVRIIRFDNSSDDTGGEGGGGIAVTPTPLLQTGDTGGGGCTVVRSNDVLATDTGTASVNARTIISDAFNVQAGWWYYPETNEMICIEPGDRFVVRISAAADPISMAGTLVFEEIGKRGN